MIRFGPVLRLRTRPLFTLVTMLLLAGACSNERLKAALSVPNDEVTDGQWVRDSTLIASKPTLLFRSLHTKAGDEVIPIATIGAQGFQILRMGNRGWHYLDLIYLHEGSTLDAIHDGRVAGTAALIRGHWETGKPALDSMAGCQVMVPGGLATVPTGTRLLIAGARPAVQPMPGLSSSELQEALDRATNLIVPSTGVPISLLSRYTREIHLVSTGTSDKPTIVLMLDDPEVVADSVMAQGERPRQVVLVLNNARFGYKVTFQYTTLGNMKTPPRYQWLDFIDTDNDGKAELLFGLRGVSAPKIAPLYTIGLHYKNDVWTESIRYDRTRCQG